MACNKCECVCRSSPEQATFLKGESIEREPRGHLRTARGATEGPAVLPPHENYRKSAREYYHNTAKVAVLLGKQI
jgi:hypothetical protein